MLQTQTVVSKSVLSWFLVLGSLVNLQAFSLRLGITMVN